MSGIPTETHTEDGIPIRKLYVSNLPAKATRTELFDVFAQYGFIRSFWIRMKENGTNRPPVPQIAFMTYNDPADAQKALKAPQQEKTLRGRSLKILPADSWHQPTEDAEGRVHWKPRKKRSDVSTPSSQPKAPSQRATDAPETAADSGEASTSETRNPTPEETEELEGEPVNTILDVLNRDCLSHILSYLSLNELIRSERVSKGWQNMVQEYFSDMRLLKTSQRWQHVPLTLTTSVLRCLLRRLGGGLTRLHIDHYLTALNDRTPHAIGKFCPNLVELKVADMKTKHWHHLINGCKQLKILSFIFCDNITDKSLVNVMKKGSNIENITLTNSSHVSGLFLTGTSSRLTSLAFSNCSNLQGTVLSAAIDTMPNLIVLKLDEFPVSMWEIVPLILNKLPNLEELSLSGYKSKEKSRHGNEEFCQSLATLKELRRLDISRNIYISNEVLKQMAQTCPKLKSLNVSSCNSRKDDSYSGVSDDGVIAVCNGCPELSKLDVSYLAALTDRGASAAAKCPQLRTLHARGNLGITAAALATCLASCQYLKEIDVCGSESVSEEVVYAAIRALEQHPRVLRLYVASTAVQEYPSHKMLAVDIEDDRCFPDLDDSLEDVRPGRRR